MSSASRWHSNVLWVHSLVKTPACIRDKICLFNWFLKDWKIAIERYCMPVNGWGSTQECYWKKKQLRPKLPNCFWDMTSVDFMTDAFMLFSVSMKSPTHPVWNHPGVSDVKTRNGRYYVHSIGIIWPAKMPQTSQANACYTSQAAKPAFEAEPWLSWYSFFLTWFCSLRHHTNEIWLVNWVNHWAFFKIQDGGQD